MHISEFEKRRNSIWAKCEKELGAPIVRPIRDGIESDVVRLSKDTPETLEDLEGYLRDNIRTWKALLLQGKAQPSSDSTGAKPKKQYRKCYERRFYLINFVMDRPYKRGNRIDWKRMVAKWNRAHPSDPMGLDSLRVQYQRAIKEDTLMLQVHISRGNQLLAKSWQPLEKHLSDLAEKNPFGFVVGSIVGRKTWDDTQPFILALQESIRNSPMFKEIKSHNPEQAARLESELEAIENMGNLNPAIKKASQ